METFADFFWFMLWFFLWVIWLMLLFRVFGDIFRSDASGLAKAGWILFVLVLPFLGVLVYLVTQGNNMAQRDVETMQAIDDAQKAYIRDAAGVSTADELEKLSALVQKGVLSDEEFQAQKAKLLA